ncbi:NAD(P)-dependent oxidoreductase [Clostridium boliviensis]|uniref:NAD(P)-dependent oxidoreductase n=1 Tax=Clostridium boliviensis TaxID=318465 RepID=A0ABU4GM14_9CLOT|nr:NAD(P)-dependent oxidoreductase [Clostridium boliviensis]MDW2798052.1 NAD(P)-dependent oxidoreductase [Clostridium boliviensis]
MNVLVTGINGFVGGYLFSRLRSAGHKIYGLGREPSSLYDLDGYYTVDITKKFQLDREFDAVIHLAALNRTTIGADIDSRIFSRINVEGTKNLIESCGYSRFIYISTAAVYAREGKLITEESPVVPVGNYAETKYEAELLCQSLIPCKKLMILRPVNISGAGQKKIAVVPLFFDRARNHEALELSVSPSKIIQLLDVTDFTMAISQCLDFFCSGIFNLAPQDCMTMLQLVNKILKLCDSKSSLVIKEVKEEAPSLVCAEKARQRLSFQALKTMNNILEDYYESLNGGTE